ncbi:MAG: NAD(P)/FAD-dependent oxidoreductase [Planctomycetes bacterium]|nr:NAD(P)/FAD-dependent oxidoreductase [Planctomycetota bacterium]
MATTRPRIVIVGGGFAGAYCAQRLNRILRRRDVEVVLIDRHNYFVFYPLLVEAGTGSLEPRHAVVPIREFLDRGEFVMSEVTDVDVRRRRVIHTLKGSDRREEMSYDHLVLACGSVTRMPDIPGLRERGFQLKSLADAVALRDRAILMLEMANATKDRTMQEALLRCVVVGGSFTGVEVAGEFDELIRRAVRRYPHVAPDACGMTLVEMGDRVLPPLGADLSDFALRHLRRRGIDVRLKTTVREVGEDFVTLDTGTRLPTRTVIWCAGIEPDPLVRRLDVPTDERGYIRCARDGRVEGFDDLWAIGDAAVNRDAGGHAYPATAQHAVQLGTAVADNVDRALRGAATRPCDLKTRGSLAAIGCRTGVARIFGFKLAGFPAWFLWRTVYLLKMPRLSRRVRVALDWTINLFFSPDYVQLGMAEARKRRSDGGARASGGP